MNRMRNSAHSFIAVVVVLATFAAVGCVGAGGTSPSSPPQSPQTSVRLAAQPQSISTGTSTVLSWQATNASTVKIQGVGTFGPSGTVKVSPTQTTQYTAIATGPGGNAQSVVQVTVS